MQKNQHQFKVSFYYFSDPEVFSRVFLLYYPFYSFSVGGGVAHLIRNEILFLSFSLRLFVSAISENGIGNKNSASVDFNTLRNEKLLGSIVKSGDYRYY